MAMLMENSTLLTLIFRKGYTTNLAKSKKPIRKLQLTRHPKTLLKLGFGGKSAPIKNLRAEPNAN